MYLLNAEVKELHKLQYNSSNANSEFLPLILAAKGKVVNLEELRVALIKAIEVMQERLNINSKLKEILSNGRLALLNEQL
jgi:hypothetical protein